MICFNLFKPLLWLRIDFLCENKYFKSITLKYIHSKNKFYKKLYTVTTMLFVFFFFNFYFTNIHIYVVYLNTTNFSFPDMITIIIIIILVSCNNSILYHHQLINNPHALYWIPELFRLNFNFIHLWELTYSCVII